MRNFTFSIVVFILASIPSFICAQYAPNMGASGDFIFFSRTGSISNTGSSQITGNIGSNAGTISGFGTPASYTGVFHNTDAASWKAQFDIAAALGQLNTQTEATVIPSTLGSGLTLQEGIYKTDVSCQLDGDLVLDGGGDNNAVFVFQVAGGFSVTDLSTLTLVNGARPCNIFWSVGYGVTIGAGSSFSGTIISRSGINFASACTFTGRAFSTAGNISMNTLTATLPEGPFIVTKDPDCGISTGSVIINAPSGPGYTYSVGAAFQASSSFANLNPGIYPITVKADNGMFISSGVNTVINPQFEPFVSIELGLASKFVLYCGAGTVANSGTSYISKGDIGSNSGTCSGLNTPTFTGGLVQSQNATTVQTASDLAGAFNQLKSQAPTGNVSGSPFNGQLIQAGIYRIPGNFFQTGNLVLDGGGNPDALFIFQISGSLGTEARSSLILKNGTRASRVFWAVNGAVNFGLHSSFAGTIVNNSTISFGGGTILKGRALSLSGNITLSNTLIVPPFNCLTISSSILPVTFGKLTATTKNCSVVLDFEVLSQQNNKQFEIEHASGAQVNWQTISTIAGDGTVASLKTYSVTDANPAAGLNYYRVKQVDRDGKTSYSGVVAIKSNCVSTAQIITYPNPATDRITVGLPAGMDNSVIRIINATGQVLTSVAASSTLTSIPTSGYASGLYNVQVVNKGAVIFNKSIIKN